MCILPSTRNGLYYPPNESFVFIKSDYFNCLISPIADMCRGKPDTYMARHPYHCDRYITCTNNTVHVHQCMNKLCFNTETNTCGQTGKLRLILFTVNITQDITVLLKCAENFMTGATCEAGNSCSSRTAGHGLARIVKFFFCFLYAVYYFFSLSPCRYISIY